MRKFDDDNLFNDKIKYGKKDFRKNNRKGHNKPKFAAKNFNPDEFWDKKDKNDKEEVDIYGEEL